MPFTFTTTKPEPLNVHEQLKLRLGKAMRYIALLVVLLWPSLAMAGQDAAGAANRTEQTIAALNNETESVDFTDQPLNEVVDWLQTKHPKLEIKFDNIALRKAGIDPAKVLVTLEKKQVRLIELITLILDKSNPTLAYAVRDGRVVISTKASLRFK